MKSRSLLKLKKLILILILGLISNQLLAQNNIGIFFQAVARDNYSNPAKSRKIYIQSSVIQSSATGTKVLIEEHQANTDATGMFNISIGNGNRVGGSATGFSSIDWSNGPFFLNLKVAITPMSGVTGWDYTKEWVDMGTTSFGAVPYALYAANAAGVNQKLNISDTSNMLSVYAKAMALQNLATTVNTKLSLSDSLTKYVTPTMLAANAFDSTSLSNRINLKANATDLNTSLATKVDKVTGKELSTNDYTTAEKTKLAAITGTNTGDQDLSALATNAALALKANTADVNTALALKANTTDVNTSLATKANTADVTTALATKVDKVTGKELSTNDYTTAEKSKLAAITGTNTGDQDLSALATNTALALKANTTDVTTALNLKANTTDVNTAVATKANTADVNTALATKVDKVTGKALSTNDYTTAEKSKLAAITGTNTGDQDLSALATNAALALKANTADVNNSLATKENSLNKSVNITTDAASDTKYPSVKSVKTYVDAQVAGANIADADANTKGKIQLAGDLAGTAASPTVPGLALKANTSSLSTVATSGSYNDLSNKPTIPSAYTLPTASASVLGGVKVGSNLSLDANGVLSANINAGSISGTVTVANGGTGATTLTGLVKGNGTNALTAAVAGTDYQAPLTLNTTGTGAATFSGTTLTIPTYSLPIADGTNLGGVKVGSNLSVDGSGVLSANINAGSISGTVTVANGGTGATSLTGLVKGNGTNALTAAVAGTDYQAPLTLTTTGTGAATFSGTTLTIPTYSLPIADGTNLGGVKVGSNLNVDANGVLTANINAGTLTGTTLAANVVNSSLTSVGTVTSGTISLTTDITTSGTLKAGAVIYPNIHGTNGQVLTTTGSGTLSWTSIPAPDLTNYVTTNTAQTITSAKTFSETTTFSKDLAVNGITVGRGGGNESTNTAIGTAALTSNTTGNSNTAVGMNALSANQTGSYSTAIGLDALKLSTGGYNTAFGAFALENNTTGVNNVAIGPLALSGNTTGTLNTAIGNQANVASGGLTNATAIGNGAIVTASNTIQLGNGSVTDVKTSGNLTVNGITVGRGGGNKSTNTASGANALLINTSGEFNTATGSNALKSNITGNSNTAIGYFALESNTGSNNTAVGQDALRGSKGTGSTNNTAIGYEALRGVTVVGSNVTSTLTGTGNTAVGQSAGKLITTGSNNITIGGGDLVITGSDNTLVGVGASASGSLSNATAIGKGATAGASNTTAIGNGATAGFSNATAIGNGALAIASNTIQLGNTSVTNLKTAGTITAGAVTYPNTVLGNQNGNFLTIVTDGTNPVGVAAWAPLTLETLVGTTPTLPSSLINSSLQTVGTITAGVWNGTTIAIANGGTGSNTKNFVDLTTAQSIAGVKTFTDDAIVNGITFGKGGGNKLYNTAIGYRTLSANTSGNDNTATGADALKSNTEGVYNTAYGSSTLLSNSTGSGNTAIGYTALFSNLTDGNSKGDNNTAIGIGALKWNTTGSNNTASGKSALIENTTGSYNAAIGHDAGSYLANGSTDNTTSDYSVYLGSNTKASADNAQNETVIGYNAIGAGSNTIQLGNTSVTNVKTSGTVSAGGFTTTGVILASGTVSAGGLLTWGDFYGTNIVASGKVTAASYITTSDLRLKSKITPLANSLETVMQLNPVHYMKKGSLASTAYTREENGFIAQEIQKILPFVVTEGKDENKLLSVDYNSFIPVLTKAIQEQQKQIEDQNAKIAAQQKQIEELIKLMKELKK